LLASVGQPAGDAAHGEHAGEAGGREAQGRPILLLSRLRLLFFL
jgi:hypothetical protein